MTKLARVSVPRPPVGASDLQDTPTRTAARAGTDREMVQVLRYARDKYSIICMCKNHYTFQLTGGVDAPPFD